MPYVTNLDFVSWSSYDGMDLNSSDLAATLNYMQSQMPTNKAPVIPGRRVWVGEYGWGASTSEAQEPLNRAYIQRLLPWAPRFILFWEIYNNEPNRSFWLIDSNNVKVASWHLHQRFINNARLFTARFKETNGRLPNDQEFGFARHPHAGPPFAPFGSSEPLERPTIDAERHRRGASKALSAQGVYGDDYAAVRLFWGTPRWRNRARPMGTEPMVGGEHKFQSGSSTPPNSRIWCRRPTIISAFMRAMPPARLGRPRPANSAR